MFRTIQCSEINFDNTDYLMSFPAESDRIRASVGMIGVVQPIVVDGCPCSGGYTILAGFRRAYACRQLGLTSVNAYLYQVSQENRLSAFWLALQENASHRSFNVVEKSLILTKLLTQFQCSRAEVIKEYLSLLGLSAHGKVLDIYLKIHEFSDEAKTYLASHELPMSVLELVGNLGSNDRHALFTLIIELRLGVNTIKEVLTHLDEIALREGSSITQILNSEQIQDVLADDNLPGPQKAEQVRRIIRTLRYPQFTELEQRYNRVCQQLPIPKGVRVQADRFFEDDRLSVAFQFQKPEDLQRIAEELRELAKQPELSEVLNLVQGKARENL